MNILGKCARPSLADHGRGPARAFLSPFRWNAPCCREQRILCLSQAGSALLVIGSNSSGLNQFRGSWLWRGPGLVIWRPPVYTGSRESVTPTVVGGSRRFHHISVTQRRPSVTERRPTGTPGRWQRSIDSRPGPVQAAGESPAALPDPKKGQAARCDPGRALPCRFGQAP